MGSGARVVMGGGSFFFLWEGGARSRGGSSSSAYNVFDGAKQVSRRQLTDSPAAPTLVTLDEARTMVEAKRKVGAWKHGIPARGHERRSAGWIGVGLILEAHAATAGRTGPLSLPGLLSLLGLPTLPTLLT